MVVLYFLLLGLLKSRDLISPPVLSLGDKLGRAMAGCRGGLMSGGRLMVLMAEDERDGADLRPGFWVWPSGGCALIGRGVGRPFLSSRIFHVSLLKIRLGCFAIFNHVCTFNIITFLIQL